MSDRSSLDRLRRRFAALPKTAVAAMRSELERQADGLTRKIALAAPVGDEGNLRRSVRYEMQEFRAVIRAGGPLTTREPSSNASLTGQFVRGLKAGLKGHKVAYDYALAVEYGTGKAQAQPFFHPTYRAQKSAIGKAIKRAMAKAVKEAR